MNTIKLPRPVRIYLVLSVLIVMHFLFLLAYFEPAISTPDAHSYFAQAKLLAKDGTTFFEAESALQYIGPHWNQTRDNRYYCTHPPGLPLILSVIYRLFGPKATFLVNPVLCSLSLLGLFLLCRLWIGEGWGLLAVALMMVNPFANEHALFGDSHTAVSFFLIWGLFFLAQWMETVSYGWIFGTGLFFGMIPTIRYPEVLFLLTAAIVVVASLRRDKKSWYSLIAGLIGVAIPLGVLCLRNQVAYGAFWKTGYTLTNEQSALSLTYFARNMIPYLQRLLIEGASLLFPLGLIGMFVLCRRCWKRGMLLVLLSVPITLLYMSWYWKPDPQSMRFLLPTFYVYTITTVWLLALWFRQRPKAVRTVSLLLLLLTILWGLPQSYLRLQYLKQQNAFLAHITNILEKRVETGSFVIAHELIAQHLDIIDSWRLIGASNLRPSGSAQESDSSRNMSPQRGPIRSKATLERYAELSGKAFFEAVSYDIWQWTGTQRKVYLLIPETEIDDFGRQISPDDKLLTIAKIDDPERRLRDAPMKLAIAGMLGPKKVREPHALSNDSHQRFHVPLAKEAFILVEWEQRGGFFNSF